MLQPRDHNIPHLNTSYGGTGMTELKARQIVLAARPRGKPQRTDFRLEETAIPTPGAGQVLLRVQYLCLGEPMAVRSPGWLLRAEVNQSCSAGVVGNREELAEMPTVRGRQNENASTLRVEA